MNHGDEDMGDSSDYDEPPLRFRNLSEVYQDCVQVEMTSNEEEHELLIVMEEPGKYHGVAGDSDWVEVMESELRSINKNKTWEMVKLPAGDKPIGLKWVLKLKKNANGEVLKHKARLVAKVMYQSKE